ncbi:MAG: ATP-binding protein, partial [Pirellulales bacterium]|nr:ATP-binding protein [Pirellulales bacterium]
ETQLADVIVKPQEMPMVLQQYSKRRDRTQVVDAVTPVDETSIEHVFRLLQVRHKIDFNDYKPQTIGRRIERRIQLNQTGGNIDEYVRRLEEDPAEVDQLYRDLLIGVTRFFRDVGPFNVLARDILPSLLQACKPGEDFRVWVAACATGEEAYSIAIVIDECLRRMNLQLNVKIFATDVHRASIEFAHAGIYSAASLEKISAERRDRYFIEQEAGYQVSADLRKMIVFAPHNLVKDAPFTRLSLVTCRNLLIYLRTAAQKKVLSLFHFGLATGGVVVLGSSESPGDLADEFEVVDDRWRIFRKRRDIRLPPLMRGEVAMNASLLQVAANPPPTKPTTTSQSETIAAYRELLDRFMPPAILVDSQREIVQVFGGAGKFLTIGDGQLTSNVMQMVDEELKIALTGAMQRCIKSGEPVCYERLRISSADGDQEVRLVISPVKSGAALTKYLVTLEPLQLQLEEASQPTEQLDLDEISRHQLGDLEQELVHTKENLQATIEEMETSNEELQATNEELIASNEELQSTNEELHSVNEELYTVNAEHQRKIAELTELTNDVHNLLISTDVHTLFLDANLCIRKFTPKMAEVFNLVDHDVGRRIDAFSATISCDDLIAKTAQVFETGQQWEEEVQDKRGQFFLMRVLPYKADEMTRGVVLTLIDISSVVAAQQDALRERERFERAIAANRDGTWDWPDLKKDEMWWSPSCYYVLGYEPDAFPSRHSEWLCRIHPDDRKRIQQTSVPDQEQCYVEVHRRFEYRMLHQSGEYRWYCHRAVVDHDQHGEAIRMTGSIADIHDRKMAEEQSAQAILRRDNFLSMLSHELRNPMGAVLNAIQLYEPEETAAESVVKHELGTDHSGLRVIDRQIKHMARLLDDLLDVARFGQGRIEFRKEVVDLARIADEVIESVNHEFRTKQQQLHMSICEGPLNVLGDPARLKQAQVNLLVNASKYTSEHGEIWYEVGSCQEEAEITIRDSGEGIPPELLETIFDLFVQSESTLARSSGGMGVGLSLARSIVEAHRGSITAQSSGIGNGSTFQIRLPLTAIELENLPPATSPEVMDRKLLLVEDNDDARTMLAKVLKRRGFDVAVAANGKSALQMFDSFRPDVAIIDIGLPLMDGYQIARQIRGDSQWSQTILIALTGYGRQSDRDTALQAGFDEHLVKPLSLPELFDQIAKSSRGKTKQADC